MTDFLAFPSTEALEAVREFSPNGVVEIGAGDGPWILAMREAGIDCVGYDPEPSPGVSCVQRGDHHSALKHPERSWLCIWPRSGSFVEEWIAVAPNSIIMLGAEKNAMLPFVEPANSTLLKSVGLKGVKHDSVLKIWSIKQ